MNPPGLHNPPVSPEILFLRPYSRSPLDRYLRFQLDYGNDLPPMWWFLTGQRSSTFCARLRGDLGSFPCVQTTVEPITVLWVKVYRLEVSVLLFEHNKIW